MDKKEDEEEKDEKKDMLLEIKWNKYLMHSSSVSYVDL